MMPAEFAAYLGALSWVPQIYSFFATPKLKLTTARTIEVGYSTFGPVVNVGTAISVSRRDTLIEKIELLVKHQESSGQQRFVWVWLNELQHQITSPGAPMIEIRKNQPAIALKVSTHHRSHF